MSRVKNPQTITPSELLPDVCVGYKIIAVVGNATDWAAYAGPTDASDEDIIIGIKGYKLVYSQAKYLFPTLDHNLHYR